MTLPFSPQDALVAAMMVTAAADGEMTDQEGAAISDTIARLPVFRGFPEGRFGQISAVVVELLQEEDGIDQTLRMIDEVLPERLRATAYALACDVAASDSDASLEELNFLEILRHGLGVDRLTAAAIERGARVRYARL
ncbi:MAG: tellurite resistance TerB family protein [Rubrimonas sp.]|uniref:tellurite resistance TerB family protein n=1 Tax=Rubrimonas sp. TaxID=2036015 RepID=UPI002FDD43C7